jgi:arsenite-transporting ATPase
VLPDEVKDEYFDAWHRAQKKYDALVETAFSPVPIRRTPLFDHEIVGLAALGEMAEAIFGGEDPTQRCRNTSRR